MPAHVTLIPNPAWLQAAKRTTAEADWFKGLKPISCPPVTARENLRLAPGVYMQKVDEGVAGPAASAFDLDKMSATQLKVLAAQMGVKLEGRPKREEVVALIQAELDKTEIEDDAPE